MICPCCGTHLSPDQALTAFIRQQGPVAQRILRTLAAANDPMPGAALVDSVYVLAPDGGPINATGSLYCAITALRPRLAQIGWVIRSHGWDGYLLERAA